ncbi:MAG: HNH endonuclease, partial [Proteobacteria bacterium]
SIPFIKMPHFDETKAYAELGFASLFDYLVRGQRYSEGAAQRRISAARIAKHHPGIEQKIADGSLNLTQLSKMAVAAKHDRKVHGVKKSIEETAQIIEALENLNGSDTDLVIAQNYSLPPSRDEGVVIGKDDYCLTIRLSREQWNKFEEVQSALSHKLFDASYTEILEALCDHFLSSRSSAKKRTKSEQADLEKSSTKQSLMPDAVKPHGDDPVHFPEEASAAAGDAGMSRDSELKTELTDATAAAAVNERRRQHVPVPLQRLVFGRAGNRCEYVSDETGNRCGASYQLQIDHLVPVACGGLNQLENLRILCRTHNLLEAQRWGLQHWPGKTTRDERV